MVASPLFTINGLSSPQAVLEGSTVTVALVSTIGVDRVTWSVHGLFSIAAVVVPTFSLSGSPTGSTATFTMPAPGDGYGCALGITCTVNGGLLNGTPSANLVKKGKVYVKDAAGQTTYFPGETNEGNSSQGWSDLQKRMTSASVGGVPIVLAGDATGGINSVTVVKLRNNAIKSQTLNASTDGYVLTWVNSASDWEAKPSAGGGGGGSQNLASVLAIGNSASSLKITNLATPTASGDATNLLSLGTMQAFQLGSTPYTINPADIYSYYRVNASGSAIAITLPATSVGLGRTYTFKDANASAATHNITLTAAGSDTIGGAATYVINQALGSVTIVSDGGFNWDIIDTYKQPISGALIDMGGDVTGFAATSTVVKLQGNALASGTNGLAQDGYVLTWVNGSSQYIAKPAAGGGFTAGGDLSGTSSSQTVLSITGAAGAVAISSSGNILTWNTATTAPGLKQANNTTNSATAATMTIQAANATGTTATGGALTLTSGTGTSAAGALNLQTGASTKLAIAAAGTITLSAYGLGLLHSSAGGAITSSTVVDADVSAAAAIAVTKLAAGTSAQVLLNNATPAPAWTTLSADATISNTGAVSVVAITGAAGAVNISTSGNILTWNTATTAPGLKQADNTTNSATAAAMTIQSANATGTTATGGALNLVSGTGTTASGAVVLKTGASTRLTVNATGVITIANLGLGLVHADASGNLTSSTLVNADVAAAAAIAVTKLAAGTSGQFLLNNATPTPTWTTLTGDVTNTSAGAMSVVAITGAAGSVPIASTGNILTWNVATTAPGIKQADNITNSATAATMTIQSANATGTTATGGALTLTSGTGTTLAGAVNLSTGGTVRATALPSGTVTIGGAILNGLATPQVVGDRDWTSLNSGTIVSHITGTGLRGIQGYQINAGAQSYRIEMLKARGTKDALTVLNNADGIGRLDFRAWDGAAWTSTAYVDAEVATEYNSVVNASRLNLRATGPVMATNNGDGYDHKTFVSFTHERQFTSVSTTPFTYSIAVNDATMGHIEVTIRGTKAADGYTFFRIYHQAFKKRGGTLTLMGPTFWDMSVADDDSLWSATGSVVSNAYQISIAGPAAATVVWDIGIRRQQYTNPS